MKLISIVRDEHGKEIFTVIESEGKNSLDFYPQESQKSFYHGKEHIVKLVKVQYKHSDDELTLIWNTL